MADDDDPIKEIVIASGATRFEYVVDLGNDPETGKRRQHRRRFPTRPEAVKAYGKLMQELEDETYIMPNDIELTPFLARYERHAIRSVEKGTAANIKYALKAVNRWVETRTERRVQKLRQRDIEDFVDWMLTKGRVRGGPTGTGLSARTTNLSLVYLIAALNWAIDEDLVRKNVALRVEIPRWARTAQKVARREKKAKIYNPKQVQIFLAKNTHSRLDSTARLALMGLRPAENCGVRWEEDIDWGSFAEFCDEHLKRWCRDCYGADDDYRLATIDVGNTRTLVDGEIEEKDAKSEMGNRTLPMPAFVVFPLRDFYLRQQKERLKAGEAYEYSGYVLVDALGRPYTPAQLRDEIYVMMDHAGLHRTVLYNCRHVCLTFLAMNGAAASVIAKWAGHADGGELAMRVYIEPDDTDMVKASKVLGRMFA
ncbi:tyrosine-type recombinase/integrase [Lentzea sp. NPDC092896]|uniref:tyrosine-type recombinase/integrase n=1 Tax=Lentzea sp. NPDC092896 TaxID=3364127 RepID=UPI0037FB4973